MLGLTRLQGFSVSQCWVAWALWHGAESCQKMYVLLFYPRFYYSAQGLNVGLQVDSKALLEEVWRHVMTLVTHNSQDHRKWWKLCSHYHKGFNGARAKPPLIPPVDILVLVKVLFVRRRPKPLRFLRVFDLVQQALGLDGTVFLAFFGAQTILSLSCTTGI